MNLILTDSRKRKDLCVFETEKTETLQLGLKNRATRERKIVEECGEFSASMHDRGKKD